MSGFRSLRVLHLAVGGVQCRCSSWASGECIPRAAHKDAGGEVEHGGHVAPEPAFCGGLGPPCRGVAGRCVRVGVRVGRLGGPLGGDRVEAALRVLQRRSP